MLWEAIAITNLINVFAQYLPLLVTMAQAVSPPLKKSALKY